MAFGSSWGTSKSYEAQIKAMEKVPVGSLGQAVFTLKAPELHDSMLYLFEVS